MRYFTFFLYTALVFALYFIIFLSVFLFRSLCGPLVHSLFSILSLFVYFLIALGLCGCACAFSALVSGVTLRCGAQVLIFGLLSWVDTGSRGTGFSRCSTGTQQLQPEI